MTYLNALRALTKPPRLLSLRTPPCAEFALLRRCLGESGFGPGVWLAWEEARLNAPSAQLDQVIRAYQRAHGLDDDGECGKETWAMLAGFVPGKWGTAAPVVVHGAEDALRSRFVALARKYIGIRELPGSKHNRGPEIDEFIRHCGLDPAANKNDGVAWCGCFLRYCLDRAAEQEGIKLPFRISPSVPTIVAVAKTQGRLLPSSQVRGGDLWIWRDGERFRHVEVCLGPAVNGRVKTVGGNTSGGTGSVNDGDGCYARSRPISGNLFVNVCSTK